MVAGFPLTISLAAMGSIIRERRGPVNGICGSRNTGSRPAGDLAHGAGRIAADKVSAS